MKKTILILATVALAAVSCKGFLEEEPKLSQSNELTLSTFEGLNNATAGAYYYLNSNAWMGCQYVLNNELMAGNATNPKSLPGSGRYRTIEPWSFTESSTWSTWTYAYLTINAANNVINNVDKLYGADIPQEAANLKAEGLFLRALCHFQLVNIYSQPYLKGENANDPLGVPVMLVSQIGLPKRDSVGVVYRQVVKDLIEAEGLMDPSYVRDDVTDPLATVTQPAIQALLSRVYLYMGEWQKCAEYATKVINSGKFALYDKEDYKAMWAQNTASTKGEIIFEMFSSKKNDSWDDSGWTMLPYITSPSGSADVCATDDLYALYADGDVRKEMFVDNENDHFITKYAGKTGSVDPKEANVPVLRLAEMYLNRAEAIYNGAVIPGETAQKDLDALTSKRGAASVSPGSETIFNERRKELAFEGHIFFDYKRLGKSITRTDFRASGENQNVVFPGKIWAMPIPKAELDANSNMVPNP